MKFPTSRGALGEPAPLARGRALAWVTLLCRAIPAGARTINGADLREAQLRGANLVLTSMNGADLRRADLTAAELNGARLRNADLRGARMDRNTDFNGANTRHCIGCP